MENKVKGTGYDVGNDGKYCSDCGQYLCYCNQHYTDHQSK